MDINKLDKIAEACSIDPLESVEYPPVAISKGEKLIKNKAKDQLLPIPIGTYGNFSFIQAPPKTKKTFFVSLLAGVYLSGTNNFSLCRSYKQLRKFEYTSERIYNIICIGIRKLWIYSS